MLTNTTTWTNWAGTFSCHPSRIEFPGSEDEIASIVRSASEGGEHVKVIGSGHSFTDIGCTDGCLIKLDRYRRVVSVDVDRSTITVEAGATILDIAGALAEHGLAMENMGDVGYQTIAGAISTATHGTGERFRNLSSQVVGMSIVQANGEVLRCSEEMNADVFRAARVGLGALGVVSTVMLKCVPAYNIHSLQEPRPVDTVLEQLDSLFATNDHFEFFWWPHTRWAQAITNTRTQEPPSSKQRRTGPVAYAKDMVIENHLFGMIQRAAKIRRAWIPRVAGLTARTMARKEMTDRSDRVFANERLVRFAEMEYAVPREPLVSAVREIRRMIERCGFQISFPVEVRATAADDVPLSPSYRRATGYVAVHVYHKFEYEPYFREVEAIMNAHEGRPHWGKLHFQTAATLRSRYPLWDAFMGMRRRLDPNGVFDNAYLRRVIGTPGAGV